ncbi:S1C family serine protease [uncultured Hymenobacter sp.]|uniref:S1C family serine protease n=1 Tax=uncultured Hymenobacter sp. TaxID=170016 RepID=UPI0035CC2DF8
MQTEADYYALFEALDRGELAPDARASLRVRLTQEPALAQRYAEFRELTGTLAAYAGRRRTRQQLRELHAAMLSPEAPTLMTADSNPAALFPTPAAAPKLHISRVERRLRDFWNGHRATIGVAASVAVLAVFSTLLGLQWWKAYQQKSSLYGYTTLKLEVDRLKKNQRAINRNLSQLDLLPAPDAPRDARDARDQSKFSGTGVALTADGYLVTSYHVIQGADSLVVEGHDKHRYHAEAVYADRKHDLAILRITEAGFGGFGRLPYAVKATETDLGERVYTLGYPREDVVYGEGALSARSGFEGDPAFYQISIPVNPGNSGGPLLDERGNLIGIISGRQADVQSAAFATKSSYLVRLVDSLAAAQPAAPAYRLPRTGQLAGISRPRQLRKLQDFVFVVKVYE